MIFLLCAHGIPTLVAFFISPDIVVFDKNGHRHVPPHNRKEYLVPSPVIGFIITSVDLLLEKIKSNSTSSRKSHDKSIGKRTLDAMILPA